MANNHDALGEALDSVMDCRICGRFVIREKGCICEEEIPDPDWVCDYCRHEGFGDFTIHFRACARELIDYFSEEAHRLRDHGRAQAMFIRLQDQLLDMLRSEADGLPARLTGDGRI